jgi:hypothetical protein
VGRRLTNALLLATVLTLVSTGLIAWALPETQATPLYSLHRIAGVGLLLALPWKQLVARASLARRVRLGIAGQRRRILAGDGRDARDVHRPAEHHDDAAQRPEEHAACTCLKSHAMPDARIVVVRLARAPVAHKFDPRDHAALPDLARVRQERDRVAPASTQTFFVHASGRPYSVVAASAIIRRLLRQTGLKPERGRVGPRPYDLRATFAVHRLTRWYRNGVDLAGRLPWLSAYMGHVDLLGTEVYLKATPELFAIASKRLRARLRTAETAR